MSISLIVWLLASVDFKTLNNEFSIINMVNVIEAFLLIMLIRLVMAYRWKILLSSFNIYTSYLHLVSIIFISNSIGHILPGGIGTDIVRSYQLTKKEGMAEKIAASVFIDRIFGFISMLILALLASIYASIKYTLDLEIPILICVVILGLISTYILVKYLSKHKLPNILKFKLTASAVNFYNKFIYALKELNMSWLLIFKSLALSLLVQLIRCITFFILFKGLNVDANIIYFFVFIPIIFILMLLPISIGGLGIREASLFYFFGQFGFQLSTCTLVGLLFHTLQIAALLPGLILYMQNKKN